MFDETKDFTFTGDSEKNCSQDKESLAEPEKILKDKRHDSERAGYDVGFERALADWIINHRANWRKNRNPETQLTRTNFGSLGSSA